MAREHRARVEVIRLKPQKEPRMPLLNLLPAFLADLAGYVPREHLTQTVETMQRNEAARRELEAELAALKSSPKAAPTDSPPVPPAEALSATKLGEAAPPAPSERPIVVGSRWKHPNSSVIWTVDAVFSAGVVRLAHWTGKKTLTPSILRLAYCWLSDPPQAPIADPNPIIRAAEGVTLEPGEYELVEFSQWDTPQHHVGDVCPVPSACQGEAADRDGWVFIFHSDYSWSWVTAVRRVEPQQESRPAAETPQPQPGGDNSTRDVAQGVDTDDESRLLLLASGLSGASPKPGELDDDRANSVHSATSRDGVHSRYRSERGNSGAPSEAQRSSLAGLDRRAGDAADAADKEESTESAIAERHVGEVLAQHAASGIKVERRSIGAEPDIEREREAKTPSGSVDAATQPGGGPSGELYIPAVGETVRVVELCPGYHPNGSVEVGSEFVAAIVLTHHAQSSKGFVCVHPPGNHGGAWCRVVPVTTDKPSGDRSDRDLALDAIEARYEHEPDFGEFDAFREALNCAFNAGLSERVTECSELNERLARIRYHAGGSEVERLTEQLSAATARAEEQGRAAVDLFDEIQRMKAAARCRGGESEAAPPVVAELGTTKRGFRIFGQVPTQSGGTVRVQESGSCVWLFLDREGCKEHLGRHMKPDPLINADQAAALRGALDLFISERVAEGAVGS